MIIVADIMLYLMVDHYHNTLIKKKKKTTRKNTFHFNGNTNLDFLFLGSKYVAFLLFFKEFRS
jgi:hypothetical protein